MGKNNAETSAGQPLQGGASGAPLPPIGGPNEHVKPSWQMEVMQNIWAQQGLRSQQQAYNQPPPPRPPLPNGANQQPAGVPPVQQIPPTPPAQMPGQQPVYGQPLPGTPTGYTPYPNSAFSSAPPVDYPPRSGSKIWLILIALLVLSVGIGAGLFFYLQKQQQSVNNAQNIATQAFKNALTTKTYTESLTVESGNNAVTHNRIADFRKIDEPHVYIDNIAANSTDSPIEVTIIGKDYFAKKHFSDKEVAAATAEKKQIIAKVNDQWTQVIKVGQPLTTPEASLLNLATLGSQRIMVPSTVLMGYFREDDQKQLSDFITQNQIYTAPATAPSEEAIDDQPAWKFTVAINADKVRELNTKAAEKLGIKDAAKLSESLKDTVPQKMDVIVRKQDQRLLQYSYTLTDTTYTFRYDKIDANQDIKAPSAESAPAGAQASDEEIQQALLSVVQALSAYQAADNAIPDNAAAFDEFATNEIDATIRSKYHLQMKEAQPERGYIYYIPKAACNENADNYEKVDADSSFVLLTRLSNKLYCGGNNV